MLAALLTTLLLASPAAGWRTSGEAFGEQVEVEVRDFGDAEAEAALRAAMAELAAAEADTAALTVRLNGAAGGDPVEIAQPARALLERALAFCRWSEGAHGPLGGVLYELWQRPPPPPAALLAASETAGCDRLRLEPAGARLAAGSRVDLRGFAAGWAVDRTIEVLRDHGAANALVRLGAVQRALGAGPSGDGWAPQLDLPPAWLGPLAPPRLRDRALARVAQPGEQLAGGRHAAHLNQRNGRPPHGMAATIAVSELAVDAQALAIAMFVLGQREGMLRLGSLRPEPSVAWLMGSGESPPLLTTHRWAAVD